MVDANFFVGTGLNWNTDEKQFNTSDSTGIKANGTIDFASVAHQTDTYAALSANVNSLELLGITGVDLELGGLINFNNTNRSDKERIDWTTATNLTNDPESIFVDQDISSQTELQVLNGHGSLDIGRVM